MTVGGTAKACRVPAWWLIMLPDVHNLSLQLPGSIFRESLMSRPYLLKDNYHYNVANGNICLINICLINICF